MQGTLRATRLFAVLLVLVLGFSILPGAMFGKPVAQNAAAAPNIVEVGWMSEIVGWNPLTMEMTEDYVACFLMYSSLFTYDQDWEGPVNDLALSWNWTQHLDGSMTTIINITQNAYFHGKNATGKADPRDTSHPLTARDVAYTIRLIQNVTGGTFSTYMEGIDSVKALDSWTLRIDCSVAKATLIDDLADVPILPMYVWEDSRTPQGKNPKAGLNPDDNIGSGPFVFDSYMRASWWTFRTVPSQYYHAAQDYGRVVKIDGVRYNYISDSQALALAMNQGTLDVAMVSGDVNVYRNVLGGPGTKVHLIKQAVKEMGITDIAINAIPENIGGTPGQFRTHNYAKGNPVLQDYYVRKAIMMTLNKDYIVNNILYGLATKACSVVPPGNWQANIQNQVPFDPAAAKQLLLDHGYTLVGNILQVGETSLAHSKYGVPVGTPLSGIRVQAPDTDPSWGVIAESWAGWAAQAGIGMVASVERESPTMNNVAWYGGDYDIWVWHWGWGPEPLGSILSVWLTSEIFGGGDNVQMPMGAEWWGPDNATSSPTGEVYSTFDEIWYEAVHTLDTAQRKVLVDQLQQMVYDSMCENPPVYDLGLYAFTDYRYDGWGDWEAHDGRSIYSDLLWLWFDLQPAANRSPFFNQPPDVSYDVLVGTPKTFQVTVSDPDGDPLLVNWTFGDGGSAQSTVTGDTKVPQVVSITHTYTTLASGLTMNVSAWDHVADHEVKVPAVVNVLSSPNLGPVITWMTATPPAPGNIYVGTSSSWSATAHDAESGTSGYGLLITWTWGDGTYTVHRVPTLANGVPYTDTATHTWTSANTYNVKVSVWDGFNIQSDALHNVSVTQQYVILVNTAPSIPSIATMDGIEGLPLSCQASSVDQDPDPLTFTWDWGNNTYTVDTHSAQAGATITSTVTHTWATPGNYAVTVYCYDGQTLNVSQNAVAHIQPAGTPVPPSGIGVKCYPDPAVVGSKVWINVSASDGNADPLTIYITYGDGVGTSVNSTLGGTSGPQYINVSYTYDIDGTMAITVYVNDSFADGSHNVSETFNLDVVPANGPPTFALQSQYTGYYNRTVTISPVALSDPDGDPLEAWYDWGDDTAMTPGNATNVGSHVYGMLGTFTVTVSVDDGQGHNVSATRQITITDSNLKPDIMLFNYEPKRATNFVDDKFWFNVTVRDFEGDKINLTIDFGDGSAVEKVQVTVQPDTNSTPQTFSHSFSAAKLDGYTVLVSASDGMDHYNKTPRQSRATIIIEEKQSKGGGLSMAMIGAIAAAIAAVLLVMAFLVSRRRKKSGGEESTMEGMAPPESNEPPPPS